MLTRSHLLAAALLAAIPGATTLLSSSTAGTSNHGTTYEVSVTNLTRGQIFSPPVVVTHSRALEPLWQLGQPASSELANVAEDAVNQPLIDRLWHSGQVRDVQVITGANGPILPGETAKVTIQGNPGWYDRLSLVGMLVITNDAFYGLDGVELPNRSVAEHTSPAYDAGSEANSEKCEFIPGPPCNNPGKRDTAHAEGYVHVHAGIHGIADLAPATYDWRNDVALVRIRRLR